MLFSKKFKRLLVVLLFLLLAGFFCWQWASQPVVSGEKSQQIFVVKKGESLSETAFRLQQASLIKSSLAFRLLVLSQGMAGQIQAGDFRLSPGMEPQKIAQILTQGTLDIWLTFPEGWRREEVARRLTANLVEFDTAAFLTLSAQKEGFLFPDTYLIPYEASPAAILRIFQRNFEKKFSPLLLDRAQEKRLTQEQILIFASMVERETHHPKDRPIVAGILLKRWQNGWPLQVDATLQYAKANEQCLVIGDQCDWWPTVTAIDKKINSPYNTYLYPGLPPTPICNPGLETIEAVIEPYQTEYWYYLSDTRGQTHYARTIEEHNQNIAQYLN